jgi:hypothetical protein
MSWNWLNAYGLLEGSFRNDGTRKAPLVLKIAHFSVFSRTTEMTKQLPYISCTYYMITLNITFLEMKSQPAHQEVTVTILVTDATKLRTRNGKYSTVEERNLLKITVYEDAVRV